MKKNKIIAKAILSAIAFNASAAPNINNILNQVFSSSGSSNSTSSDSKKKRSTGLAQKTDLRFIIMPSKFFLESSKVN